MKTIGQTELWSFLEDGQSSLITNNHDIRRSAGCTVSSFYELAHKVAELQFRNPGYVHLFRGQASDHIENGLTTLKPSIFRRKTIHDEQAHRASLERRFRRMKVAESLLSENFWAWVERLGKTQIQRVRLARWSVLQHYDICPTPLLDLTHSLRIAASFASLNLDCNEAFLFVLGVPHVSGTITVSAESGLQLVRLAPMCPPTSMRPHLQEGYLIGEYPDIDDFDQKRLYQPEEVDFGHRLLAKFRFNPSKLWDDHKSSLIPRLALYPESDPILPLAKKIREEARLRVPPL